MVVRLVSQAQAGAPVIRQEQLRAVVVADGVRQAAPAYQQHRIGLVEQLAKQSHSTVTH